MRRFLILISCLVLSPAVFAALGGDVHTITADQARMRAQLRAAASNGYTVHELQTAAGVAVREFVADNGKVFAIAWEGPNMPDLEQLLGAYFPEFNAAMSTRRKAGIRGPVALQHDDLIVESNGRMRSFFGRAYVPSLLPPQVTPDEIQ
ncbi:MAG TPA: DUF2844 domain-containing protein [Spongiibacteraceae bacterium]|jgi:hypothetical protein